MSDRYIQSIYSKDAPVWKLLCEQRGSYIVQQQDCSSGQSHNLALPTSEYMEVPAPEWWEDVTAQCGLMSHLVYEQTETIGKRDVARICDLYRLKKVDVNFIGPGVKHGCQRGVAFIIERKVNP